jgi:hypothetical protein
MDLESSAGFFDSSPTLDTFDAVTTSMPREPLQEQGARDTSVVSDQIMRARYPLRTRGTGMRQNHVATISSQIQRRTPTSWPASYNNTVAVVSVARFVHDATELQETVLILQTPGLDMNLL